MSIQSTEQEFFTVKEVAQLLRVSVDTVTRRFEGLPGVLNLGSSESRFRRRYSVLRIPKSALNSFIAKVRVQ